MPRHDDVNSDDLLAEAPEAVDFLPRGTPILVHAVLGRVLVDHDLGGLRGRGHERGDQDRGSERERATHG